MAFAAAIFNVLVCIVLPLGVLVWLLLRHRRFAGVYLVGAAVFLASQVLTRIPLLSFLGTLPDYVSFATGNPALYAILLGLSAGVFEECGRYIALHLMKRHRSFNAALSFGMGHGGVEAILIGVNSLWILLFNPAYLASASPAYVALAGVERIFAMLLHIGLSVLVMHAVAHQRPRWLFLAILLHGGVDAAVGLLSLWGFDVMVIEAFLIVFSLSTAALAFTLRKKFVADFPVAKGGTL